LSPEGEKGTKNKKKYKTLGNVHHKNTEREGKSKPKTPIKQENKAAIH